MNQHVGQEPPCLLPLMGVVYKYLRDWPRRVSLPLGRIINEQYDFDNRNQYHTDGRRPACVLLFVGTVCIYEYTFSMVVDCLTQHKTGREKG